MFEKVSDLFRKRGFIDGRGTFEISLQGMTAMTTFEEELSILCSKLAYLISKLKCAIAKLDMPTQLQK